MRTSGCGGASPGVQPLKKEVTIVNEVSENNQTHTANTACKHSSEYAAVKRWMAA